MLFLRNNNISAAIINHSFYPQRIWNNGVSYIARLLHIIFLNSYSWDIFFSSLWRLQFLIGGLSSQNYMYNLDILSDRFIRVAYTERITSATDFCLDVMRNMSNVSKVLLIALLLTTISKPISQWQKSLQAFPILFCPWTIALWYWSFGFS